ncbi:MAG: [FeFe] hydrogenase H-cluster maturation GTPase HydF [Clostridiales bacterium]|jgi:[FeFe] hydrogenase H-cluster maturation GTPase HydF|nr:[FeFe] hydrogenase H-cluster maturation GTPase HydF [Clostridiales bacterium]
MIAGAMNDAPSSVRVHIGFFGVRNAGKSAVVNAVTGQDLSVVSEVKGATTDPVKKSMELSPVGPVLIIDTPGIDDDGGELGKLRVNRALRVLESADVAVLVVDAERGLGAYDLELVEAFKKRGVGYIIAYNKSDVLETAPDGLGQNEIYISAKNNVNIDSLKEKIAGIAKTSDVKLQLVGDLISPADFVVLVTPIDKAAPKGRLILPQQQVIRDVLEADAIAVVTKEFELRETLERLGSPPRLVVTDSQAFSKVSADVPPEIPLTSFSILFARYNGLLDISVKSAAVLEDVEDGDKILICEGCTHHRQCDDIGSVKIPRWIRNYTGKNPEFSFASGGEFTDEPGKYKMIVHCGGCMLNARNTRRRAEFAASENAPFTNYGVIIAYMQGILKRVASVFPHLESVL